MATRAPKPALPSMARYLPPQPTFIASCWRCRALLMREKGQIVSGCLGLPHVCATNEGEAFSVVAGEGVLP